MVRPAKKRSFKTGLSPGSLVFYGRKKVRKSVISLFDYTSRSYNEKKVKDIKECFPFKNKRSITWINVDGLHETNIIEKVGKNYDIHPLVLEDILTTDQRPKVDIFDDYIFIVLRMLGYDEKKEEIVSEQVSLILGKNFVISFQETSGDIFDPLREKIRKKKGKLVKMKSDYLMYSLLDIIVDYYFTLLERFGERIDLLEEELIKDPKSETLNEIYLMKREVLSLRKSVWPLREAINKLDRSESNLIRKSTLPYLRDLYDHTIQIIDTIEASRDLLAGMLDVYLSSVSHKTNEIMKVLTIIATIFIPLTFITGVYGTNFVFLPELGWHFGYFGMWIVMILVGGLMMVYFKMKKWL